MTVACILTSPDGITWTRAANACDTTGQHIGGADICWSDPLALYVMVGASQLGTGQANDWVQTSPDGATWTVQSATASPYLGLGQSTGVAAASAGPAHKVVASYQKASATSPAGVMVSDTTLAASWVYQQAQPFSSNNKINQIAWDGSQYVAAQVDQVTGLYHVATSPDGYDPWTVNAYPGFTILALAAHAGTILVGSDANEIGRSTDGGATWTVYSVPFLVEGIVWANPAGTPTWVAVGVDSNNAYSMISVDDGVTWNTPTLLDSNAAAAGVAWVGAAGPTGTDTFEFVAVGQRSDPSHNFEPAAWTSHNATVWAPQVLPCSGGPTFAAGGGTLRKVVWSPSLSLWAAVGLTTVGTPLVTTANWSVGSVRIA